MIDLVAKKGARVMHVFFRDNLIPMQKCLELNKKEYASTVCKDERSGKSLGSEKSLEVDDDETEDVESLGSSQSSVAITTFVVSLFISHLFL